MSFLALARQEGPLDIFEILNCITSGELPCKIG